MFQMTHFITIVKSTILYIMMTNKNLTYKLFEAAIVDVQ